MSTERVRARNAHHRLQAAATNVTSASHLVCEARDLYPDPMAQQVFDAVNAQLLVCAKAIAGMQVAAKVYVDAEDTP